MELKGKALCARATPPSTTSAIITTPATLHRIIPRREPVPKLFPVISNLIIFVIAAAFVVALVFVLVVVVVSVVVIASRQAGAGSPGE